MATKKPGDAPASETGLKKPVEETGGIPDPKPEPEPPVLPERFQDKKIKDVIEMCEKAEKERDRSGTDVGKLREELDGFRNTASYYQNRAQDLQGKLEKGGENPESEVEPDTTGFYDNPLPLIRQEIQSVLKKDRETREGTEQKREFQRASMNFATGRSKAMEGNPDLFRGIEKRIEEGMWQYFKSGRVSADELRDPETWENGARILHMANKDWDRIAPPKVVPVSPTPTEKPGAANKVVPEEKPIDFNPDQREMIHGLGGKELTDKEVTEMVKKERERAKKEEE